MEYGNVCRVVTEIQSGRLSLLWISSAKECQLGGTGRCAFALALSSGTFSPQD